MLGTNSSLLPSMKSKCLATTKQEAGGEGGLLGNLGADCKLALNARAD